MLRRSVLLRQAAGILNTPIAPSRPTTRFAPLQLREVTESLAVLQRALHEVQKLSRDKRLEKLGLDEMDRKCKVCATIPAVRRSLYRAG